MQHRDALVQTLLSLFIPFYILYWSYITAKEIEKTYSFKAPNILLLIAPAILLAIAMFALFVGLATGSQEGAASGGIAFLLMFFVGLPLSIALSLVYYYQFGGIVEKVAGPEAGRVLLFILFWFISPAGVYIAQEKLNSVAAEPPAQWQPPQPTAPQGPPPTPPTV